MDTSGMYTLIFDIATYALFAFFACLVFIYWYLGKDEETDSEMKEKYTIWANVLFRYRDFTRKRFGKVHFIYYLSILLLTTVSLLFSFGLLLQIQQLDAPFNVLVGITGIVILVFVAGMFYRVSKIRYYE